MDNTDFNYECGLNKFMLSLIGAWPESEEKFYEKYGILVNALIVTIGLLIPRFIAVFFLWDQIDFVIQGCAFNMTFMLCILKMIVIYRRKHVFVNALTYMAEDWTRSMSKAEYKIMLKMAKFSRRITIISVFLTFSGTCFGLIVQVGFNLETSLMIRSDDRVTTDNIWIVYLPYDSTNGIKYMFTWIVQFYTSCICGFTYSNVDNLLAVFVLHLCGQLGILQIWLRHLGECKNSEDFKLMLQRIIKRHLFLNKLAASFEDSFNMILLLQLLSCMLIFCFQGFSITTKMLTGEMNTFQTVFALAYTILTGIIVFYYCWIGEILTSESTAISYAIYESEWYHLSAKQARSLMFIGYGTTRPLILTVGKFAPFSLNLFLTVLKTSMSYLSVLLTIKSSTIS